MRKKISELWRSFQRNTFSLDIQVDFILVIIKNASVSYYKLSFRIRPSWFVSQIRKFKINGILQGKTNIQEGIFLSIITNWELKNSTATLLMCKLSLWWVSFHLRLLSYKTSTFSQLNNWSENKLWRYAVSK